MPVVQITITPLSLIQPHLIIIRVPSSTGLLTLILPARSFQVSLSLKKIFFFKSILITLFELNKLLKSVARITFFCVVFNKVLLSDVDILWKFR